MRNNIVCDLELRQRNNYNLIKYIWTEKISLKFQLTDILMKPVIIRNNILVMKIVIIRNNILVMKKSA